MKNMFIREISIIEKNLSIYLNDGIFKACALGYSHYDNNNFERIKFFSGITDKNNQCFPVKDNTYFDVASLTKPMVTVLSLLALMKDGKIDMEEKLSSLLKKEIPPDKKEIKLHHLISHFSGLPSHKPYYNELVKLKPKKREEAVVDWILGEKLECNPGEKYIYSDLDYILLGYIIEKKSGEKLDRYWKRKITDPLSISQEFYFSNEKAKGEYLEFAATGRCLWTSEKLKGLVHDDNCRALGGVSGHAGLFATLEGIMDLSESIAMQYSKKFEHPSISIKDLNKFIKKKGEKRDHWAYGFDVPSGDLSASGKYFSKNTIGHLGFTGTSFWIDLKRKKIVTLLTNRVLCCSDKKKIKDFRVNIHNDVLSLFDRDKQNYPLTI